MWGLTLERSTTLRAISREIRTDSLVLGVRAREVRHAPRLCGGSEPDEAILAARIVSVILERPTCLTCLAPKVGAPALSIVRTIESIGQTVKVEVEHDQRCRACGSDLGPTYSLRR
jgi:hypothetical protein